PQADVAERRGVVVPDRGADVPRAVDPQPAADDAVRGTPFAVEPSRPVGRCAVIVVVPFVRAPLPHIPQHIVETPGVRRLQANRPRAGALVRVLLLPPATGVYSLVKLEPHPAVAAIPGDRVEHRSVVLTQDPHLASIGRLLRPRPAGILPLSFRRQAQLQPRRKIVEPADEPLHVFE